MQRDMENNAETQFQLAKMYFKGEGVKQDYKKAFYFWEKVAKQGYEEAQCNLGVMYEHGYGVQQNYSNAYEWFEKSANQGYIEAQYNLGVMYQNGYGVQKIIKKHVNGMKNRQFKDMQWHKIT